jgi:hypothetical protein
MFVDPALYPEFYYFILLLQIIMTVGSCYALQQLTMAAGLQIYEQWQGVWHAEAALISIIQ